jgi:hypothetical protein
MKKTLSILALSAVIGLGAVHAMAADPTTPPAPPAGDQGPGPGGPGGHEGGPGHFMKDADKNNDGFLTRDEMEAKQKEHLDEMFAKADTDHDGKLSREELKAFHEQMRAKMQERFKDMKERRDEGKGGDAK